jgi:hypothetical protein
MYVAINNAEEIYNLDFLVCVKVFDKQIERRWKYYEPVIKKLFRKAREEYFTFSFAYELYSKEDLESGKLEGIKFIVEDNKVYYRPYVELVFCGGVKKTVEFDTVEEANKYKNEMAAKINRDLRFSKK